MTDIIKSGALLLVLLNPFLVILYLVDMVEKFDSKQFARVLVQGSIIATVVFCSFAVLGDAIFSRIMQMEFASFQIFGGVIFLLIGLQFVFKGPGAIEALKGGAAGLAGAIAMPVMIGPGTISASVVIGKRHDIFQACATIVVVVSIFVVLMVALKEVHDFVRPRNAPVINRYIEIAGRIQALYVGTVAVEMIMQGIKTWAGKF